MSSDTKLGAKRLTFLKTIGGIAIASKIGGGLIDNGKKPIRLKVNLPPTTEKFRQWGKEHVTDKFVERNEKGIAYERNNQIDKAIQMYEANVRDKAWGDHPYKRLFIIYKKQGYYIDAQRIANAYIKLDDEFQKIKNDRPNSRTLMINGKRNFFLDGLAKLKNKNKI